LQRSDPRVELLLGELRLEGAGALRPKRRVAWRMLCHGRLEEISVGFGAPRPGADGAAGIGAAAAAGRRRNGRSGGSARCWRGWLGSRPASMPTMAMGPWGTRESNTIARQLATAGALLTSSAPPRRDPRNPLQPAHVSLDSFGAGLAAYLANVSNEQHAPQTSPRL